MDISIRLGNASVKLNTNMLMCKLMLFSILIPARGSILGITFGANLILLLCFAGQFLASQKIVSNIPKFCLAYILISLFEILIHFSDKSLSNNIIAVARLIAPVYVILIGVTDLEKFRSMLQFIVKVFTVYGVLGIIETLTHFNFFDAVTGTKVVYEHANELRFGLARNRGALDVSINNGMLLCMVLCIAAYVLIYSSKKEHKFYMCCYLIIFIDTFLTLSRGIWMELIATQVLIFLALTSKEKRKIVAKIFIAIVLIVAVLSILSPKILNNITYIVQEMMKSIFDALTGADTSDTSEMNYGVGHRFALWSWVWEKTQGYLIFGTGYSIPFLFVVSPTYIKESIEVMWLYMLYHVGFVGLFGYIIYQIGSICYMIKGYVLEKIILENKKVTFNYVILVATILYFFTQFSCSAFEDLRFYYIMLSLTFAYNRILLRQKKGM